MDPYRPLYVRDDRSPEPADPEDRALAFLLIVLGVARVAPAVFAGQAFGAEATVALIMLLAGLVMVVRVPGSRR